MKCLGEQFRKLTICRVPFIRDRFCRSSLQWSDVGSSSDRRFDWPSSSKLRLSEELPLGADFDDAYESNDINVFIAIEVRVMRESLAYLLVQHSDIRVISSHQIEDPPNQGSEGIDIVRFAS